MLAVAALKPNRDENAGEAPDSVQKLSTVESNIPLPTPCTFLSKRIFLLAKMPRVMQSVWEAMLHTRCRNHRSSAAYSVEMRSLCLMSARTRRAANFSEWIEMIEIAEISAHVSLAHRSLKHH